MIPAEWRAEQTWRLKRSTCLRTLLAPPRWSVMAEWCHGADPIPVSACTAVLQLPAAPLPGSLSSGGVSQGIVPVVRGAPLLRLGRTSTLHPRRTPSLQHHQRTLRDPLLDLQHQNDINQSPGAQRKSTLAPGDLHTTQRTENNREASDRLNTQNFVLWKRRAHWTVCYLAARLYRTSSSCNLMRHFNLEKMTHMITFFPFFKPCISLMWGHSEMSMRPLTFMDGLGKTFLALKGLGMGPSFELKSSFKTVKQWSLQQHNLF